MGLLMLKAPVFDILPPGPLKTPPELMFFCQTLHHLDNAYVFPPLALVGIVLRFLASQPCPFTTGVPDRFHSRYWWPVISGRAQVSVHLGVLGDHDVLYFISHFSRCISFSSFALGHLGFRVST